MIKLSMWLPLLDISVGNFNSTFDLVPVEGHSVFPLEVSNRELTQQDGGKTQDGRMTKKCAARLCISGLARHFYTSFCRPESYSRPVA